MSEAEALERETFPVDTIRVVEAKLIQLNELWAQIGISGSLLKDRDDMARDHILDLLDQMIEEDSTLLQKIQHNIESGTRKMLQFCTELSMDMPELLQGPPLEKERDLIRRLEEVEKLRDARLQRLEELRQQESALCLSLAMEPHTFGQERPLPSERDLEELNQHVHMLTQEKATRFRKYNLLRSDVRLMMGLLERAPSSQLERELLAQSADLDEEISLAQARMENIKALADKLSEDKRRAEQLLVRQRGELQLLWEGLETEDLHRLEFLESNNHCGQSALNAMSEEIERCREQRRANMQQYVSKIRLDLVGCWDRCHVPQTERDSFKPFTCDDYTEDLMKRHEQEVLYWKGIFEDHKRLFKKLDERKRLWERMLYFQKRTHDSNRFNNRGGNLLQEEKERNTLLRRLPELEQELCHLAEQFQQETRRPFLIDGMTMTDYITTEWQNLQMEKENEKQQRAALKQRQIQEEMKYTPSKRARMTPGAAGSTPFKTPAGTSMALRTFGASSTVSSLAPQAMAMRSPAMTSTPLRSRRQPLKSPRVVAGNGSKAKTVSTTPGHGRRGVLQTQNRDDAQTPGPASATGGATTPSRALFSSSSSVSINSFMQHLNDSGRPAYKRSTMVSNSSHNKVLGSKVAPTFTNSGARRRRSGDKFALARGQPHKSHSMLSRSKTGQNSTLKPVQPMPFLF